MWYRGLVTHLICFSIGFAIYNLAPMQAHLTAKHITMSFDKIYFAVILILAIGKAATGKLLHQVMWVRRADLCDPGTHSRVPERHLSARARAEGGARFFAEEREGKRHLIVEVNA
ncbi:MAG: hypothetical protein WCL39_12375 [Armatimonadota bacterium]